MLACTGVIGDRGDTCLVYFVNWAVERKEASCRSMVSEGEKEEKNEEKIPGVGVKKSKLIRRLK